MKHNVALVQVNHKFGNNVFLPHSVGLIKAYCQTIDEITTQFNFLDFVYLRNDPVQTAQNLDAPRIVGISCYLWNWEWSKLLAKSVRERHPDCLIVLGGPQVPGKSQNFFQEHPYIDILVHHEGELTFAEILQEHLKKCPDYTQIPGTSVRLEDNQCFRGENRMRTNDLGIIPSPYISGCFDDLMTEPYDFHASQETHRGCPYSCTFCDWGSAVFTKVRSFSDDRLHKELEWFGRNHIELLYNCDANYGLLKRDLNLTKKMVETKKRYGFPQQFRAAYAKNSDSKIFEISKLLNDAGMSKGLTLSFQSLDDNTLELIKRNNIKVTDFESLLERYRQEGIATYTEIIMGLPGESYDSFANGVEQFLNAGQHDGLNIYICILIQNSEMAEPEYVKRHGIKTVRTPVLLAHSSRSEDQVVEYNDIVVQTNDMPTASLKKSFLYSWAVQAFHNMGLTQYLALFWRSKFEHRYRLFYEELIDFASENPKSLIGREFEKTSNLLERAVSGGAWGVILPEFGDVLWPTEESTFLTMVSNKDEFYGEMSKFLKLLLSRDGDNLDEGCLVELLNYQKNMIIDPFTLPTFNIDLSYNFHEYFESIYNNAPISLVQRPSRLEIIPEVTFEGDLHNYSRSIVWYGRKAGKFRHKNVQIASRNDIDSIG